MDFGFMDGLPFRRFSKRLILFWNAGQEDGQLTVCFAKGETGDRHYSIAS
jgi:hypothetical protein